MSRHPAGSATSAAHLFLVLSRAARALGASARRSIENTGLCLSDFAVLEALLHKGPLPVSALGQKVLLTSGSITTAVDRLAARRLVRRRNDPGDRRVRLVELTARGRQLIEPAFERHAADLERATAVLTRAERGTLVALLRKLGTAVDANTKGAA